MRPGLLGQGCLGHESDCPFDLLAVLEHNQGWNAANVGIPWGLRVLVGVEPAHLELAVIASAADYRN